MTTTVYRRAGSIFFLCRFHPLEQGAQWVLILVSRYRRFFADSHSDTVSLTTAHRCGTVVGKEPKNSGQSGTRTRNLCGFFTPARFTSGGRQRYKTLWGKLPAVFVRFLSLPTPTGAAPRNVSLWSPLMTKETFL
ncbi:hypothetical protein [Xylella fastidiosa]|uniref:hypothetical protein n=1 Tax=Xylella fastidiosa TaxID=2371 RepID=UPI001F02538C|nr:hypothetical protein [Xylella fastidiosa]WLE26492.1 hypothetical protein DVS74_006625 [Xylella fastidiosa subsp. multiplex]